eukprot:4638725-Pyramimonas_sp.AAC.1
MKGPGDFSARQWRKWREQQEREELAQLPPAKKKKVAQDLRKKLKVLEEASQSEWKNATARG